ncbi:FxSxx-COOH cyclophane-containing RiPP peptide [Streptosporangium sp. NPDC049046]|uniref:FxSxx-COOH cyclophane-containing RiPP peptide n=1 Tax=Streptosporangium sp. NPDC049046 TaxID=3155031 RepID=UPI00343FD6DE
MSDETVIADTDYRKGLIDLTGMNLADLDGIDDSALGLALREIVEDEDTGPVAGFDSFISKPL